MSMPLEQKMKLYRTVRDKNCQKCGNPWFFDIYPKYECTTCAYAYLQPGAEETRREDIAQTIIDVVDVVSVVADVFGGDGGVADTSSSSDSSWGGGGGDFNGGGASGDW